MGNEESGQKPETPVADIDFVDVRPGDWYYDAVAYVSENGIMTGVDEGVFDPEGSVTRAMIWATETGLINGMNGYLQLQDGATRAQLAAMLMRALDA